MNIQVSYDTKTKRLVMKSPFVLVDAMREYPNRKFEPKTKTWRMPVVRSNIEHFERTRHLYPYQLDDEAKAAVQNFEALSALPKKIPFPADHPFHKAQLPYEPMEHQIRMLDHSWGLKASAWIAKMGTGKTFAAVHLAFARWRQKQIDGVMIICPSTLRATWAKEIAKFATGPYEFRSHDPKASWLTEFYLDRRTDRLSFMAVSVEGLGVSEALYLSACGYFVNRRVMVICDESSRIKNPDAKRTKRAWDLGAAGEYRMILNGTPTAIGLEDLFAQYEFLDPNIIGVGDYWSFRTRYLVFGGYENRQVVGYQRAEELMAQISPYTIEIGKDVLNLPPKVPVERYVEITAEQRKMLKLVTKGSTGDPNEPLIKVENSLEKILRCRQIVGGWLPRGKMVTRVIDGLEVEEIETEMIPFPTNPKLDMLLSLVEDNVKTSKFIIWSTFIHEIDAIYERLAKEYGPASVARYYGETSMEDRSRIEDRYCNDPSLRFFVGNPATAGLGLTLISGESDVMVYYSGTNAYIDRAQSEDRAHRLGQKRSVTVVDLIADNTVDNLIVESVRQKMDIETYVYNRLKSGVKLDDLLSGE